MRTTITLNDKLYKMLRLRAAESGESVSAIVQDALKFQLLEDLEDLETLKKRENEPTLSFSRFVEELKSEGLL